MCAGFKPRFEVRVRPVVSGDAEGEVIFVNKYISFLGDLDSERGILHGHGCISGKLMVFLGMKGSTVGPYVIYSLSKKSLAPNAMIVKEVDPLLITGCVLSNIPLAIADEWSKLSNVLQNYCSGRGCIGKLLCREGLLIIE